MQGGILIIDFGSQYTQLIARRVRELNVYSEIYPYNKINKRLLIGLSDETKQFCTTLFFGKNRDFITKLGPNHSDKHTHVQCLDLDMRSSAGVNKKLSSLDAPNITLDYKKFFLEQDQAHIDSVAEFIGFRSTKESNEFIKQYNLRNQELYNEQK